MPFADAYTFRARVQPAFMVILPLLIFLFALLPELPLFVSALVGILGAVGGTAVMAQVGRELGRRKEPDLWKSWDGPPTTRLLRHRRTSGDIELGSGLREQFERWIEHSLPTEREEKTYPEWADVQYEEAVRALRAATRDQTRFGLVFAENVNYGFRRNLWGMKPVGASIAVVLALSSWMLLVLTVWGRPWPDPWWGILTHPDTVAVVRLTVSAVSTVAVAIWLLWVKPSWVKVMANAYALSLLEAVPTPRQT